LGFASPRGTSAEFLLKVRHLRQLIPHCREVLLVAALLRIGQPRRPRAALLGLHAVAVALGVAELDMDDLGAWHRVLHRLRGERGAMRVSFKSSARWLTAAEYAGRSIN
jgi:hypothetical protein